MNIDDFIVPTSVGTPAGISPTASALDIDLSSIPAAHTSGIAINKRQQQIQAEELPLSRASAPSQPAFQQSKASEFEYVPRHVRKTSIDERRVSGMAPLRIVHDMLTQNFVVASQEKSGSVATCATSQ